MPRRLFALNLVATALHLNACSLVVDFQHIEPTAASNAGTGNAGTGNAGTGNAGTGNGIALSTGGGLPVETAGAQSMPWAPAIAAGQAGLASASAPPGTAGMGGLNNRTSTSAAGPGGSTSLAGSSSIEPTSKGATAGTGGSNAGSAPNTGRAGALGVSDPTSHGGVGGRLTNSAGSVSLQQAGSTSLAGDAGASGSPANGGAPPTAGTKGKAAAVCVGESHNCALVDGSAYCWGNDNTYGQLGDRSSNFLIPSKIGVGPVAATVSAISCSHKHTCVVADGEAYCWGSNSDGQLAMMGGGSSATPVRIMLDGTVTSIAAGQDHSCAVANGKAFCWGYNGQGQLGDGTSTERSIPVQLTQMAIGTTAIYAGDTQSCAIKDGRAYCWGYNNWGTTGNGAPLGGSDVYTPTAVVNLSDRIQAMAAGHEHTCAIGNGVLYCWGCNVKAELGTGSTGGDTSIPLEVAILRSRGAVTAVAAGGNTTCAVADNRLYCWGQSDSGQLGTIDPSTDFSAAATEIPFEANGTITAIAVRNRACAVVDGNVYCWGSDFGYGNRPLRVSFPG